LYPLREHILLDCNTCQPNYKRDVSVVQNPLLLDFVVCYHTKNTTNSQLKQLDLANLTKKFVILTESIMEMGYPISMPLAICQFSALSIQKGFCHPSPLFGLGLAEYSPRTRP